MGLVALEDVLRILRAGGLPDQITAWAGDLLPLVRHRPRLRVLGTCRSLINRAAFDGHWWTHKIKGLHHNDFIMAAKTDELYQRP